MPRLILIYLFIFGAVYFLTYFLMKRKREAQTGEPAPVHRRFRSKTGKGVWTQVYDTDSLEDANRVLARLEEEEIECLLYEQGRKDVHGNPLRGYGISVPKTSVPRAQTVINRMPV